MTRQKWDAGEYNKHASFVASFGSNLIDNLNPSVHKNVLDLGCGDGELAEKIKSMGINVVGIDSSQEMVQATNDRGITAYVMDGHNIHFDTQFDAVFSNAVLHWLTQPEKVLAGINNVLRPNGTFIAEFGGAGNIQALLDAMQETFKEQPTFGKFKHPWYFPSLESYTDLLLEHGFRVDNIELFKRPTPLKSGVEKWLQIFANGIIHQLTSEQKEIFFESVINKLTPVLYSEETGWVADYVRLRLIATKIK